jgi:hypothetical protein
LGAITSLKKLCNHPKLIYDVLHSKTQVCSQRDVGGLSSCLAAMMG